ncbi:MAG TPA: SRPBCC domain-containing protein [Candidatus Paceibacterota bacterium]|nr:SRPBCC domain-containing protein [Candidatus Paceibacterota bacterium]
MVSIATQILETVALSRFFDAPRDRVFRAWTNPEELRSWWRPGGFSTTAVAIDLRVGGEYRIDMLSPAGKPQLLFGRYLEIRAPERLVMTFSLLGSEHDDGYEALLTLDFTESGTGTELALVHERLPRPSTAMFEAGWKRVLGDLQSYVAMPRLWEQGS